MTDLLVAPVRQRYAIEISLGGDGMEGKRNDGAALDGGPGGHAACLSIVTSCCWTISKVETLQEEGTHYSWKFRTQWFLLGSSLTLAAIN
jgi:hypothetical protein